MGIIKAGGDTLLNLITKIIQKIFEEERVPLRMKKSTIVLLHKKGNKTNPMNYRPITLNNTSIKILDAYIYDMITPILKRNNFLHEL